MAHDRAAVKLRGLAAVTNFDLSRYLDALSPGATAVMAQGLGCLGMSGCRAMVEQPYV
jgi:hypothetical protein